MEWLLPLVLTVSLGFGYVVGLLQNGINITINHKYPEVPTTTTVAPHQVESTEELLPEDVQDYMKKHKGFMDF